MGTTEDKKARKRAATAAAASVVIEGMGGVGYGEQGGSNSLVIAPKKTKKEKKEELALSRLSAQQQKRIAEIKEKRQEKVTKTQQKKLKAVQDRKKKKATEEELFAALAEHQLDSKKLSQLGSTTHMQDKEKKAQADEPVFPQKLKAFSGKIAQQATINTKERKQENYYSTDSESEEEEEEATEQLDRERQDEVTVDEVIESPMEEVKEEVPEPVAEQPRKAKKGEKTKEKEVKKEIKNEQAVAAAVQARREHVLVERTEEMEKQRSKLPIYAEEQSIVEAINTNTCVVVCGETGSGKTTQIPQFLYEAGYANNGQLIGITEPRRVAAVSMAKRVGEELNLPNKVSYQIRFEGTRSDDTSILFMTDGVLMKEMEKDVMLSRYSVILIDEAHERSMYSDVLIGMLSRIAPLRAKTDNPLKLVIMSATLRLADFTHKRLFPLGEPLVIKVDSRQFPVSVHFEKKTPDDYMSAAFRKSCRIHESLPDGAILVFVSGQNEVHQLIKKLSARYPILYETTKSGKRVIRGTKEWKKEKEAEQKELKLEDFQSQLDGEDMMESGVGGDSWVDPEEEDPHEENEGDDADMRPPPKDARPLYCLPLYSLLSTQKQRRVFDPPPEGARMCVVATNVAETSLTIPGVRYVVDSGFEKRREYDAITGVSRFRVARVSQASADQRAGRAGRVSAGHAYRLYSSAVFTDCEKFSRPEIVDKPPDQLVLHLKSMNIVKVINFPFPSSPEGDALEAAEKRLVKMGALANSTKGGATDARITTLGRTLSAFPLAPAYAKVIAMANQHDLMPHAIALISALSVREPLVAVASMRGSTDDETKERMTEMLRLRRGWCGAGAGRRLGDLIVLLKAVHASEQVNMDPVECLRLGLRYKAMIEVRKLRQQLTNIVNTTFKMQKGGDVVHDPCLEAPSDMQAQLLRQIVVAALADRIAKRVDRASTDEEVPRGSYQSQQLQEYVFIDPCSVLYSEEPDYLLYQEITQIGDKKCMQGVMSVDFEWLARLCPQYCRFGTPGRDEVAVYSKERDAVEQTVPVWFGRCEWELPTERRQVNKDINLYRHFALALLDGQVVEGMGKWRAKLLAPPHTMIREWARLQPRTEALLNALVDKQVYTRQSLEAQWEEQESYLLEEMLAWLPESQHAAFTVEWPPVDK